MFSPPLARLLPDGRRLHLQHGPIDLIVEAWGPREEIGLAYRQAVARFQDILATLVAELPLLRRPVDASHPGLEGPVARRMLAACRPHASQFVTPMAAVAGAVADEMLNALVAGRCLEKAYVNDGGDIAIHLSPGASLAAGLVGDLDAPAIDGLTTIGYATPARGVATSGRGGRSFSLGVADAVTVLARDAAAADVAATLIGNAVNVDSPAVRRVPARDLDPDSDLGDRPVTAEIGALTSEEVAAALDAGAREAGRMLGAGLIHGAVLTLRREFRVVGTGSALALPRVA